MIDRVHKFKVLAYIFREFEGRKQLLVFDHPDVPEVNPQVPAGTLNEGEAPDQGVLREVFEESGISFKKHDRYLGLFSYEDCEKSEVHMRDVYCFESNDLPDSWSHRVQSDDEDNGEVFEYYWLDISMAKKTLVAGQGRYLSRASGHIIDALELTCGHHDEKSKIGGDHASLSGYFGLKNIAAHYFKIPPGYRTSRPHAESIEEEFVYVISGEIDLWFNGKIKTMYAGECIGFPSGTGVGHCFINNSTGDCELFVSGERTKSENKYHFHLEPDLKKECGKHWWDDMPAQILGGHNGLPGPVETKDRDESIETLNAFEHLTDYSFSYPGDNETFSNGVDLGRHFGLKSVAIHFERLPVGKRSSWPHAHSREEEFVFILKGNPTVYLGGEHHCLSEFDAVDFKAGSGVAHTIVNNTNSELFYLCVGECDAVDDQIYYPEHPERNEQMRRKGLLWEIS